MKNKPTTAEIVILASGAVALVFSFFDFFGVGDAGASVWKSGLFPVATLMVIFAVISAVVVGLKVMGVALPANVLGFTWPQIHLELGFFAALYAVAYLIVKTAADRKIGFWMIPDRMPRLPRRSDPAAQRGQRTGRTHRLSSTHSV